jgi:small neutral amino acid transporter SnatA (MarC family)
LPVKLLRRVFAVVVAIIAVQMIISSLRGHL